jgi:hypothetical protein
VFAVFSIFALPPHIPGDTQAVTDQIQPLSGIYVAGIKSERVQAVGHGANSARYYLCDYLTTVSNVSCQGAAVKTL